MTARLPSQGSMKLMDLKTLVYVHSQINIALNHLFDDIGKYTTPGTFWVFLNRFSPVDAKEGNFRVTFHRSDKTDFVMLGFVRAVQQAGKDLLTCARCRKPFVAIMRQEYCSTLCSQIVRNEKKKRLKELKAKKKE